MVLDAPFLIQLKSKSDLHTDSAASTKLVADSGSKSLTSQQQQQVDGAANHAMLARHGFPNITFSHTQGAVLVAREIGKGVMAEVDNHPGRLAGDVALGLAAGAVGTVALSTAPLWATIGLGVAVVGLGVYEGYEHLPGMFNEARVAAKPENYSQDQVEQAKNQLQQLGGKLADTVAGGLGGINGVAFGAGLVKGFAAAAISGAVSSIEAPASEDAAQAVNKELTPKGAITRRAADQAQPTRATDVTSAKPENGSPAHVEGNVVNRTPADSEKVLNRLANGNLQNLRHEMDKGLIKDVIRGKSSNAEGSTDAFIRKIDPDSKTDLERIRKAQIETTIDRVTGQDTHAPLTAMRDDIEVDGRKQLIAVQEDAGKSLGANLKDWATKEYGTETPDSVQKLIEAHPTLKESVGKALFQMLYKGNSDFMELSNLAVRGTQNGAAVSLDQSLQIPIIDAKFNWTTNLEAAAAGETQSPTWGLVMSADDSMPAKVADLYAGKPLSHISLQLQRQAEALQQFYESANGQTQLQNAGLSQPEIAAATSRLQYLTKNGFPPMPTAGSDAFMKMLDELGIQGSYFNDRSQSVNLQQIMDAQMRAQ